MYIEGFGEKKVNLWNIEGTDELLELEFSHKKKKHYGIIDKTGRLLVPFSHVPIVEAFATNDRSNYCFTKQDCETGKYESFHLMKDKAGKFTLKADIVGNDITNCRLIGTIKDNYWFVESTTNGITEVCLYDVINAKILTPLFSDISFEEEESRVLAFVEKELYGEMDDGEIVYLTSLLSYIDYEGNFVTPFYDPKNDLCYDARTYNFDKSFKSFNRFLQSVTTKNLAKYMDDNSHVTEVLADMFTNLYSIEDIKKEPERAKILEFRRDVSNDKK